MKSIGPTFEPELFAANIALDGFSWGGDGTFQFGDIPQERINAILAVYAAHDPLSEAVPLAVTMRQARLALLAAGILDSVSTAIDSLPSPQKEAARIEWEYSQEVQRNKALVLSLGPALGLSDADLDQLFINAATL